MKVKHPRGSQRESGWRAAPVLVLTMDELLLASNFCRPGEATVFNVKRFLPSTAYRI